MKKFAAPEMEVVEFEAEDILISSPEEGTLGEDDLPIA